jgi:molybdopterin-guanine dinucleotide biosynthesis protein
MTSFKIVVGCSGVGKTSLVENLISGRNSTFHWSKLLTIKRSSSKFRTQPAKSVLKQFQKLISATLLEQFLYLISRTGNLWMI